MTIKTIIIIVIISITKTRISFSSKRFIIIIMISECHYCRFRHNFLTRTTRNSRNKVYDQYQRLMYCCFSSKRIFFKVNASVVVPSQLIVTSLPTEARSTAVTIAAAASLQRMNI